MALTRTACEHLAAQLHCLPIYRGDGALYLERYFIRRGHDNASLYLHHFVGDDPDDGLHDHPAKLSLSLVLVGGYYEQRYVEITFPRVGPLPPMATRERWIAPGRINVIRGTDFHRIRLGVPVRDAPNDAWTLFWRSPRVKSWGFKTPDGTYTPAKVVGY